MNQLDVTDRELLIRIDERVKSMETQLIAMRATAIPVTEHVSLMNSQKDHEARLQLLEDFKLKLNAYMGLAGAIGGIVVAIVMSFFDELLKK